MSARAFAGIPRQFVKNIRFQRIPLPKLSPKLSSKMGPNIWENNRFASRYLNEVNRPTMMTSRSMRQFLSRMKCVEMQRLQIGALYTFSYVSKEILDILKHFEELLEEEDGEEDEERTTLKGRQ